MYVHICVYVYDICASVCICVSVSVYDMCVSVMYACVYNYAKWRRGENSRCLDPSSSSSFHCGRVSD